MDKEELIIDNAKTFLQDIKPYLLNKTVIDIGCGTGIGAAFLGKECNAKYHLFDYEDLRYGNAKKLPFTKASIEKIPFKDDEFDIGQIFFTLHHLDKKISLKDALKESSRVCKKLLIIEEVRTKRTNLKKSLEIDKKNNSFLHPGASFSFTKYYNNSELQSIFKKLKLNVMRTKYIRGKAQYGNLDIYLYVLKKQ